MKNKFYNHINEYQEEQVGSRVKKIKNEEARDLVQTKCVKALEKFQKNSGYISRITQTAPGIETGFADTSKLPARMSRNTLNYYTHIINDSPEWKGFPRRQIIATGYKDPFTRGGRDEFIIFPYDSVVIGECPQADIWYSFPIISTSMGAEAEELNDFIRYLLNAPSSLKPGTIKSYDGSLKEFKTGCSKFDKWVNDIKAEEGDAFDMDEFIDLMVEGAVGQTPISSGSAKAFFKYYVDDLYKTVLYLYSPESFRYFKTGTKPFRPGGPEIWFDGPAVYVNATIVLAFVDGLI